MRLTIILLFVVSLQLKAQLTTSNLPIFIFNTNSQTIVDEPKINTELKIIYDINGGLNDVNSTNFYYDNHAGVEYSGSYSQLFPKKNLNIELRTGPPEYDDNNVGLFGFPSESDWILVANYLDLSHSKNSLSQYLYQNTGTWSPKTIHCEVVINGVYQGLYLLCEKIKRDGDRVDIKKLDEDDTTLPKISGGYLIENNNNDSIDPGYGWASSHTGDPKTFDIKYPNDPIAVQFNYIKGYFDQIETILNSPGYQDPLTGYRSLIDENSIFDYTIFQELSKNSDAYHRSQYFYKQRNEKLMLGPIWDFDFAYGRKWFNLVEPTYDFRLSTPTNSQLFWFSKLKEDCAFIEGINTKYESARSSYLTLTNINSYLDSLEVKLSAAANRDRSLWYPAETITYASRISEVKNWISNRIAWMDDNFYNIGGNAPTLTANNLSINKNNQVSFTLNGCTTNTVTWTLKEETDTSTFTTNSTTLNLPFSYSSTISGACQTSALCPIASNKVEIVVLDSCENNINLTTTLEPLPINREFKSSTTLQASSDLATHKVNFLAEKSIELNPGFMINANNNALFRAEIGICP